MKNFVQNSNIIHTVLEDTVKGGDVVTIGQVIGIAVTDGDGTSLAAVQTKGVFTLSKATGAISQGAKVYWDSSNSNVTTTSTNNTLIGKAWSAAVSADTEIEVSIG